MRALTYTLYALFQTIPGKSPEHFEINTMTRNYLLKEIARFEARVAETQCPNSATEKAAHTRARNCLNHRKRMLLSLDNTGSVIYWPDYKIK